MLLKVLDELPRTSESEVKGFINRRATKNKFCASFASFTKSAKVYSAKALDKVNSINVITCEAVALVFLYHLHHLQRCDMTQRSNIYRFILMNIHFPIYI